MVKSIDVDQLAQQISLKWIVRVVCVQGNRSTAKDKFISYLRVSSDKQGHGGLGLEAQRAAAENFLNVDRWTLATEYVEAESGTRADRPQLAKTLTHAKAIGAKMVFAKLDKLTRNVDLQRR